MNWRCSPGKWTSYLGSDRAARKQTFFGSALLPGPRDWRPLHTLGPILSGTYRQKRYNFDLTMINTGKNRYHHAPSDGHQKISFSLNKRKSTIQRLENSFQEWPEPDISDERESPALRIMDEIAHKGADVSYHDPYIPSVTTHEGRDFTSAPLTAEVLKNADCVVITTNHSCFDAAWITANARLVVDLRNAVSEESGNVFKL